MKATKDYISLETAKLLKDCRIKNKWWSVVDTNTKKRKTIPSPSNKYYGVEKDYYCCGGKIKGKEIWDIYTWQEILWEHAEEFFGENTPVEIDGFKTNYSSSYPYCCEILNLLQQKKYEEADLYFRKNCKLIQKNDKR